VLQQQEAPVIIASTVSSRRAETRGTSER